MKSIAKRGRNKKQEAMRISSSKGERKAEANSPRERNDPGNHQVNNLFVS
jgi:hypothetical protein